MERFAFIIHPLDVEDVSRKFKIARKLPDTWVEGALRFLPPLKVSHITGIKSRTGVEAEGWFVGCTLTSRQMMSLPEPYVTGRIIRAARKAAELGARIVGLGAFTSVVGDAGFTIAKNVSIPVTTGNSYTVATALQGVEYAAGIMGINLKNCTVSVLGATGSIGSACSRILAPKVGRVVLAARNASKLESLRERIQSDCQTAVDVVTDVPTAVRQADVVIAVTSALDAIVEPHDLRPGAIVCDVSRPRNVSRSVAEQRDDVLVFEGGVVSVPGNVEFNFNFGFPPGTSYACMAETMLLALERRYESFSLGRDLEVERIREISELAEKHGFQLDGLRSFERAVTKDELFRIKENALQRARQRGMELVLG